MIVDNNKILKFERSYPKISAPKTYITNNKMPSVDYKKLYEESQLDIKRLSGYAEMVCKAHAETKEDLIDFAKMKQERVFELEKELEEVKKERDIFKGLHKITRCKKVGFMNKKAYEDFDKLKEENKELKEKYCS